MMDPFLVRPDEPRGVRLFALSADQAELERLQAIIHEAEPGLASGHLADLLGVSAVDATRVEVFHTDDLSNFGLFNYLIKANGLPEEALEPDRAVIEAQQGPVLLLFSGAFRDEVVTLDPASALQFVGAWDEDLPDLEFTPLRSAAAQGNLSPDDTADAPPAPKPPKWLWWGLALAVVAAIAFFAALSGGE